MLVSGHGEVVGRCVGVEDLDHDWHGGRRVPGSRDAEELLLDADGLVVRRSVKVRRQESYSGVLVVEENIDARFGGFYRNYVTMAREVAFADVHELGVFRAN